MSINESNRKVKDRWPLEFDLEGVPRETAERERLLQQKRTLEMMEAELPNPVSNTFAVDYQQANSIIDINNPPKVPYVYREFPKMLYAPDGKQVVVRTEKEEREHLKRNFTLKPPVKEEQSI